MLLIKCCTLMIFGLMMYRRLQAVWRHCLPQTVEVRGVRQNLLDRKIQERRTSCWRGISTKCGRNQQILVVPNYEARKDSGKLPRRHPVHHVHHALPDDCWEGGWSRQQTGFRGNNLFVLSAAVDNRGIFPTKSPVFPPERVLLIWNGFSSDCEWKMRVFDIL